MMKHDMVEKVVDKENDYVRIMVKGSFLWKKYMSMIRLIEN